MALRHNYFLIFTLAVVCTDFAHANDFIEEHSTYWPSPGTKRVYRVSLFSKKNPQGRITHLLPLVSAINKDGSIDQTFGKQGGILPYFEGWDYATIDFVLEQDNELYLVGSVREDPHGGKGDYITELLDHIINYRLKKLGDHVEQAKIPGLNDVANIFVIKLDRKGKFDQNFGHNGVAEVPLKGQGVTPPSLDVVRIDNQGRSYLAIHLGIAPQSQKRTILTRLNPRGHLDSTFGEEGYLLLDHSVSGILFPSENTMRLFLTTTTEDLKSQYFLQTFNREGIQPSGLRRLAGLENRVIMAVHQDPFDRRSMIAVWQQNQKSQLARIHSANLDKYDFNFPEYSFKSDSQIAPSYGQKPGIWIADYDLRQVRVHQVAKTFQLLTKLQFSHQLGLCDVIFNSLRPKESP